MERCFVILTLLVYSFCYITSEGVSDHHWKTILFKDGLSDCHLTWLIKAQNGSQNGSQNSQDLLLTSATCLLEKPPTARRRSAPIYLPIPSKYSISLIQYDAGWQEIDRTEIKVKDVLIHPQFNGHSYTEMDNFDIAMVKLENPVYLNDQVVDKVEQIPDNGSLSDSIDCWVRGQTGKFDYGQGRWNHTLIDIKQLIEESATLTTPSLPGSSSISYLVSLGAPLICRKDHITGVYGITVRRQREVGYAMKEPGSRAHTYYSYINSLVFVSLAAHKVWIQKAIDGEIDVLKKPFHKDLYNQSEYVVREMEASDRQDVELEELTRSLNGTVTDLWYSKSIYSKIHVLPGMLDLNKLHGYTSESDAYSCAVVCYEQNDGKPCSYSFLKKRCYFSSESDSDKIKRASRFGITIFYQTK